MFIDVIFGKQKRCKFSKPDYQILVTRSNRELSSSSTTYNRSTVTKSLIITLIQVRNETTNYRSING